MPVRDFGPLSLRAVREEMIRRDWARTTVNDQVGRIRRIWKWAVGREICPPPTLHGLQAVAGLRRGRSQARETAPVRPVEPDQVEQIRTHVSRQVWAMVQLQLFTGARAGVNRIIA